MGESNQRVGPQQREAKSCILTLSQYDHQLFLSHGKAVFQVALLVVVVVAFAAGRPMMTNSQPAAEAANRASIVVCEVFGWLACPLLFLLLLCGFLRLCFPSWRALPFLIYFMCVPTTYYFLRLANEKKNFLKHFPRRNKFSSRLFVECTF